MGVSLLHATIFPVLGAFISIFCTMIVIIHRSSPPPTSDTVPFLILMWAAPSMPTGIFNSISIDHPCTVLCSKLLLLPYDPAAACEFFFFFCYCYFLILHSNSQLLTIVSTTVWHGWQHFNTCLGIRLSAAEPSRALDRHSTMSRRVDGRLTSTNTNIISPPYSYLLSSYCHCLCSISEGCSPPLKTAATQEVRKPGEVSIVICMHNIHHSTLIRLNNMLLYSHLTCPYSISNNHGMNGSQRG